MLKIVKTPTIKQFSYYFFTITKWKKKYVLCIFFPFFGDVIIHKTGTMLATGQGPIATPSGSESVTDGNGVRDPGVAAGAKGRGGRDGRNNSEVGSKIKYLSGGGVSDQTRK